ncbi:glycoside hydrolase family 172 protein [Mucilaginibacter sp.]|uniref:glycoside hydrolase family 172 protein n=1 Tax=Mucilaginibacter sp. TaxID=1882438 RepID=UPI003562E0B4
MKKLNLIYCLLLCAFTCQAQPKVTLTTLLKELTDPASVARLPNPSYVLKQVSSYDRHSVSSGQPGWFANEDHTNFLRTETIDGRKEYVMMDENGPGAIVRFWETTFKRPGTLRIYFDHEKTTRVVIPGYDLMKFPFPLGKGLLAPHSSYEAVAKGGSTLYLPLPYNKHCKVTWEDPEQNITEKRYYQINFRRYKPGTDVETFSAQLFESNKKLIVNTDAILLNPPLNDAGKNKTSILTVKSGSDVQLSLPNGSNAITCIELKLNGAGSFSDKTLRSVFLVAEFDGERTVYCPVSDFFGSGAGNNAVNSWYRTVVPKDKMIARWFMPYQHKGSISIVNKSDTTLDATVILSTKPWKWTSENLYFHADWRPENNVTIKRTEEDKPIEWDLNIIRGQGIFVGETLSVNNHMHKWYGEGDQKLWVDNETFPSEYGTGLEDYYNTSWAPVVLYQSPFANAIRADNEDSFGENTFTRTRNLDVVPFNKHFRYNVEMLGWANGTADFAATTYWYGKKTSKTLIVQKP